MKKVITFGLWGNLPRYTIGSIKNIELVPKFYPDFEVYIYIHKETVPEDIINKIKEYSYVTIIFKEGDLLKVKPMTWRFEAIDDNDVEIMMPRDIDTRILEREKFAVDEWLESGKLFHIMRDHPHHSVKIFGGMFGTKKIPGIKSWKELINKITQHGLRDNDTRLLTNFIYPKIKNNCLVHTSFKFFPNEYHKPFPIPYGKDLKFVGEYVYEDDSRSQYHINLLKKALFLQYMIRMKR